MDKKPIHILLVEDEEPHAEQIVRSFESRQDQVRLTVTGSLREARDSLKKTLPDLMICDLCLPDGRGIELLNTEKYSSPYPVLVLTAHGDETTAVEAMKAGALDYVVKSEETMREMPRIAERTLREWKLITEHKETEKALRLSEEKFSKAFRSSPTLIAICTMKEGRYLEANNAFINISGYKREEIIGRTYYDLGIWADPDVCTKTLGLIQDEGAIYNQELGFRTKTGEILTVLLSAEMIEIEGKPCILSVAQDITERKKLQGQLLHAQKMESIGTLAGGVAHDFNNLLTAIISFANLISVKLPDNDPLKHYVEQIQIVSDTASNLAKDLLTFSRKQEINPSLLDINKSITILEKMLLRIIGEDIELKIVLEDVNLIAMADSSQLQQILMNLVINARDAMSGRGVLTISAKDSIIDNDFIKDHGYGKSGAYVLISVSDTGAGMDEKTKEKIFEPFFTTKQVNEGTGLGLSIVYGIVKQHDGYIDIESEPGKGTTFKIYLPMMKEVKEVSNEINPLVNIPIEGSETILIAEDDVMTRNALTDFFKDFGYIPISANDGEDAVNKFMKNRDNIQFVVSDVIMPKKNGKELYKEIKKIRPDMNFLFMSGYSKDIIHQKDILEEGMEIISKPVKPDDILRKIRKTLDS